MNKLLLGAGAIALAGFAALALLRGADQPGGLRHEDATRVASGKLVYEAHCASCHGVALEGEPDWRQPDENGLLPAPPHDETGHTWHHPDAQLFDLTKRGPAAIVGGGYESNMPGFGDVLSDQEIWDVLSYIKSTWPRRIIEIHNQRNG